MIIKFQEYDFNHCILCGKELTEPPDKRNGYTGWESDEILKRFVDPRNGLLACCHHGESEPTDYSTDEECHPRGKRWLIDSPYLRRFL
jgi:hypothetical protein